MEELSRTQFNALWAAFKKGGAWYGRKGNLMGGAYRRMCERMAAKRLLCEGPPYAITLKGTRILRDACHARWAKSGCMAHQMDLKEIEAALAK